MTLPGYRLPSLRSCGEFSRSSRDMDREEELRTVPSWNAHRLVGDRRGVWSLSVTRNWRLTFQVDPIEGEIFDLDYQDYH